MAEPSKTEVVEPKVSIGDVDLSNIKVTAKTAQGKLEQKLLSVRDEKEIVTLVARDRSKTEITLKQAMISHWLQAQILKDEDRKKLRYYFEMFDYDALQEVAKYMRFKDGVKTAPPKAPIDSYDMKYQVTDVQDGLWICTFAPKKMFEMLKVAGILEIPGLIGLIQCRIACWCKNRTPKEISELFSERNMNKIPPKQTMPFEPV